MRCGHGREFKSGPAKPVAMVDSRSGLAGTGANPREGLKFWGAKRREDPEGQWVEGMRRAGGQVKGSDLIIGGKGGF